MVVIQQSCMNVFQKNAKDTQDDKKGNGDQE